MDLQQLEDLSLVSKITSEVFNHTGINDAVLAEYIISLHDESKNLKEFVGKINSTGAQLSLSFIENVAGLINTLRGGESKKGNNNQALNFSTQQASEEVQTEGGSGANSQKVQKSELSSKFPALSIPDDATRVPPFENEKEDLMKELGDILDSSKKNGEYFTSASGNVHGDQISRKNSHGESRGKNTSPSRNRPSRRRRLSDSDSSPRRHKSPRDTSPRTHRQSSRKRSPRRRRSPDRSKSPRRSRDSFSMPYPVSGANIQREGNAFDPSPILYKIYDGEVTRIREYGAFVRLFKVSGRVEGMVHISNITNSRTRIEHISDVVRKGQKVKVKVIFVSVNRTGLSMRDVDQETGKDLTPHLNPIAAEERKANMYNNQEDKYLVGDVPVITDVSPYSHDVRRISSPERWEIKQLIASGVLDIKDYPMYDVEQGVLSYEDDEQDLDIEIRDEEPPFLKGQTKQSIQLSPIRIVKTPDGTMNRAAMSGAALAKERKEMRKQQAAAECEEHKRDLSKPWLDPISSKTERPFAQDIKSTATNSLPEWKKAAFNNAITFGKVSNMSIKEQRESLPIFKFRETIINAVKDHQVLIVVGDTGSGKTTQMTQYLAEEGFEKGGIIGCTQPRRVAAMSVAKRVAEESGYRLGQEVGYTIRFEDCTAPETRIKYMTDGMLLRESLVDPTLSTYSVIILDEAHERTIHTDVLLGLLKKTVKERPDLKLIVTSATLDAEKFSRYFSNCPILSVPGRTYPVEILFSKEPETDYLDSALVTAMQIHLSEPPGDILIFLTGQEEIDTAAEILYERMKSLGPMVPELIILPIYSALPSEIQSKIFEPTPAGSRKVVLATNIAETSITIDGIYYVVDPGFVKQNSYDPKLGMDSLVIVPISQAQARQRAGRAGRTGPGKCYRLYTESAYHNEMLPTAVPDIQRMNLANTVLMLKAIGINDLINFDFMDPPPVQTLITAMELLYQLGALDDEGLLTIIGRKMSGFPVEPALAKSLILSVDLDCSDELLTIAAMLSVQNIWYRPKDKQAQADSKKAKFHQPEGDHLTLLAVFNSWKASKFSNTWCYDNFIQVRSIRRSQDIRRQLLGFMDKLHQDIVSCGKNYNRVRKAICGGFFRHASKKDPQEGYKTLIEPTPVYIHPSSTLFNKQPEWVIYHELVLTTKEYMREVVSIDPKWLVECAPSLYKNAGKTNISRRKKAEKLEPLYNRYEKPNEWRISRVQRGNRISQTF